MNKIFFLIPILIISLVSCKITGVKGNGNLLTEQRDIEDFERISVSGNFKVEIEIGKSKQIEIIAESNLINHIRTNVKTNTLYISSSKDLKPTEDLKIYISNPILSSIDCSGVNDILAKGIKADNFSIDLSGATNIDIEGKTTRLKIDVSGAAELMAKEFISEEISIDVSGAANAAVYASKSCNADVSGAGFIELYGDAEDVNMNISGAGSMKRK